MVGLLGMGPEQVRALANQQAMQYIAPKSAGRVVPVSGGAIRTSSPMDGLGAGLANLGAGLASYGKGKKDAAANEAYRSMLATAKETLATKDPEAIRGVAQNFISMPRGEKYGASLMKWADNLEVKNKAAAQKKSEDFAIQRYVAGLPEDRREAMMRYAVTPDGRKHVIENMGKGLFQKDAEWEFQTVKRDILDDKGSPTGKVEEIAIMVDRNDPSNLREISSATASGKVPNSVQEYQFAVGQGFNGSYNDWLVSMKKAGAPKSVGTPEKGYRNVYDDAGNLERQEPIPGSPAAQEQAQIREAAERVTQEPTVGPLGVPLADTDPLEGLPVSERGKTAAKLRVEAIKSFDSSREAVDQARNIHERLGRYVELLDGGLNTGAQYKIPGSQAVMSGVDEQVAEAKAIIDMMTPMMRQGMPGAASDRDVAMFRGATVGLDKPEQANRNIAAGLMASRENLIARDQFMQAYFDQNKHLQGADRAWNRYLDANPIFDRSAEKGSYELNENRRSWMEYFADPEAPMPNQASQATGSDGFNARNATDDQFNQMINTATEEELLRIIEELRGGDAANIQNVPRASGIR